MSLRALVEVYIYYAYCGTLTILFPVILVINTYQIYPETNPDILTTLQGRGL